MNSNSHVQAVSFGFGFCLFNIQPLAMGGPVFLAASQSVGLHVE
jgi:hypothetical protein